MLHQSKVEVYIHFVWATLGRAALLEGPLQRTVHRTIRSKAEDLGCIVLAIGGMPDHVHVVLRTPSTVSPAAVAVSLAASVVLSTAFSVLVSVAA